MEYEFSHDPINGSARAKFSVEHSIFGPWLEVEVGKETEKVTKLLQVMSDVGDNSKQVTITGKEYSISLSSEDVVVRTNMMMNGADHMPEALESDQLDFENQEGQCGLEDFRELLLSWTSFNKGGA